MELDSRNYYSTSDKEFLEISKYRTILICQLDWKNREQYFELIQKLLDGPIDFLKLRRKHKSIDRAGESLLFWKLIQNLKDSIN